MAKKKARPRKRSQRKAPAPPRFVQIAVSVYTDLEGHPTENVYALDQAGNVWWYDFNDSTWNDLSRERIESLDGGS